MQMPSGVFAHSSTSDMVKALTEGTSNAVAFYSQPLVFISHLIIANVKTPRRQAGLEALSEKLLEQVAKSVHHEGQMSELCFGTPQYMMDICFGVVLHEEVEKLR